LRLLKRFWAGRLPVFASVEAKTKLVDALVTD